MPPSTRLSWEGSSWADPTGLPSPSPVWYVFIVCHPVHHQWFLELVLDTFTVWASCNVTACFCFLSPSHCHQLTTWKIWFACFYGCTNLVMGAHQIQFLCQCLITTIGYIQSFFFWLRMDLWWTTTHNRLHYQLAIQLGLGDISEKLSWEKVSFLSW